MRNHSVIFIFVFVQTYLALLAIIAASVTNILPRGSSLSVEGSSGDNFITSPDKTFTCGFYSLGANAYWFSIWFTNSKEKTHVWMANRDMPVNHLGSRLTLRKDGAMVLTDFDGAIVWQTNTTATNAANAELLNSGNLVIKDPKGKILWQSFDFPTDTLLPTQVFTKSKTLVSSIGRNMFSSGYFKFFFDSNNVLTMMYDGPEIASIYWPPDQTNLFSDGRTTYNSSRIAFLDRMGRFSSSDQVQFSTSDMGIEIKRRLTLDYDGNLRVYSLNDSSGWWEITWQAISKLCEIHGLCGKNGICVYTPEPKCSCPPNYEPTDPSDWRKGCRPKFVRRCSDSQFVEIPHVDFFGFDLNYTPSVSFESCKNICLIDCRCKAFGYRLGDGTCYPKSTLFNGYRSNEFPGILYLRVPNSAETLEPVILNGSHLQCDGNGGKLVLLARTYEIANQRFKWVYMYGFVMIIGALELVVLVAGWWFLFRKSGTSASVDEGYRAISSQFRSFRYSELSRATEKFKDVLGAGGFGAVYKGVLREDDRVVAVKKLSGVVQGEEEFWAEVSTIGRMNHMNLARMWGFCSERKHRLLVYEFFENGSLDKHLFSDGEVVGWKERFKVALGTAKGMAYLHHECLEWVIHCDVKPENILLDEDFNPKISDFGLAKLCQRSSAHGSPKLSTIRGTKGYMAPEWATNLPITAKVDVYSYGVVILELVRGIRLSSSVVDSSSSTGTDYISEMVKFVGLAKCKIESGEDSWVEELVDPRLVGKFSRNQASLMVEVGLSCVEEDRNKRPTMETVAQVLAECEDETSVHTADD